MPEAAPQRRLDSIALHDALVSLACEAASPVRRDAAARVLLEQLRHLASSRAWSFWPNSPVWTGGDLNDLLEDAIQHVAIAASTGRARFRGNSPAEAVSWCARALRNYTVSEMRRRAPMRRELLDDDTSRHLSLADRSEGVLWRHASQDTALLLVSLDRQVRAHLRRTRTRRGAESLYNAVRRYVADVAGLSSAQDASRASPSIDHGPNDERRSRDRAYQYHHRARRVLAEMLRSEGGGSHHTRLVRRGAEPKEVEPESRQR